MFYGNVERLIFTYEKTIFTAYAIGICYLLVLRKAT